MTRRRFFRPCRSHGGRAFFVLCCCTLFLAGCLSGDRELKKGDPAPPFVLESLQGEESRFTSRGDRSWLLYFWADWCPTCEDDFRLMERIYRQWQQKGGGPILVAVNVRQDREHIAEFVAKIGASFPIWMDSNGRVARMYGIRVLPTFVLIDRHGRIGSIIPGWIDEHTIRKITADRDF